MMTSAKLREPLYQKASFLKLYMSVYLRAKFEVSSIILTSFIQGGWGVVSPPPLKKLKQKINLAQKRKNLLQIN